MKFKTHFSIVGTSLFFALLASAQENQGTNKLLDSANAAYENSECDKAIENYQTFLDTPGSTPEERDLAHYRIGYCAYSMNDLQRALSEFGQLLQKDPEQDDVRLRYAETLFADEQYDEAIKNAQMVKGDENQQSAQLLIARAYIEIQEPGKALDILKKSGGGDQPDPIVEFWKGMAYFQMFDEPAAEKAFRQSEKLSPKELWTKSASNNWLETISESKSPVHARLGVSYGDDSNIGQMTYKSSATASPDTSYYVKDSYLQYDVLLSSKPIRIDKLALVPSVSASALKYSKSSSKSYNPSSVTADITGSYALSYLWTTRASLSYTDSKYDNAFYHDYVGASFSGLYALNKRSSCHVGMSATKTVGGSESTSLAPTAGIEGDQGSFYWLGSITYDVTNGEKATYTVSGGTTSVTKGATASSYNYLTLQGGIGTVLPWGLDLLGQLSNTQTTYDKEDVPPPAAFSVAQRKDSSMTAQLTLSKSLIERRMTASLSYAYTKTTSEGFQGLKYTSGSSPDYNITRSVTSLYLSYGF